jgi:hypothetical protein
MNRKLWERCRVFLFSALLLPNCVALAQWPGASEFRESGSAENCTCGNAAEVLKRMVELSAGGPYFTKSGVPVTLQGRFLVAGESEDTHRLQLIGQAIKEYVAAHGSYPPGALLNAHGQPTVSWRVLLLPYLGQEDLYERFDLEKPWNDHGNLRLLREMPAVYRKSGAPEDSTETGFAGVGGPASLYGTASIKLNGGREVNYISATERVAAGPVGSSVHLPWTAPGDIEITRASQLGSRYAFAGESCAFTPLLFLDGTVRLIPDQTGSALMQVWTNVSNSSTLKCVCAPPTSSDAGLKAVWDLGQNGGTDVNGLEVKFLAKKAGRYRVTVRGYDRFANEYSSSTTVEVR